jgi:molybdate transport system substrate-binding protein
MNIMDWRIPARFCLVLLGAFCALGCQELASFRPTGEAPRTSDQEVVLFAAASTATALDEIAARFGEEQGVAIRANYAASSTLTQQIENGAHAEVFVSANQDWVDHLEQAGVVAERRNLLGNRLVVIFPVGSTINLQTPQDLLADEIRHLAMADPESAPAGVYGKQALENLGLWGRLRRKVVAGADVRHALSFVETGAAEAGIVYATDAAISDAVRVALDMGPELTDPICYPAVLTERGRNHPAAESFFRYLSSPRAAEVFVRHGFTMFSDTTTESL